jgi:hypothetical protein
LKSVGDRVRVTYCQTTTPVSHRLNKQSLTTIGKEGLIWTLKSICLDLRTNVVQYTPKKVKVKHTQYILR